MKHIIFTKEAIPVSDFHIEEAFLSLKNQDTILISNSILLDRFRLAYLQYEIDTFQLTIVDSKTISETIFSDGGFYNIWEAPVLKQPAFFASESISLKKELSSFPLNDIPSKIIVFTKEATPISDFHIEETFSSLKDQNYIELSSELLLSRFVLGFLRKEIPSFKFIVRNNDIDIFSQVVSPIDSLQESYSSPVAFEILNERFKYISFIFKFLRQKL